MPPVEIRTVQTRRDLRDFVNLPWSLYLNDPLWVPPLKADLARLLTPGRHPFWNFSKRELFLACRAGKPVGRIAALVDSNYNNTHNETSAAWGFFECVNDPETARALFSAAERWACGSGMTLIRGPFNPSTNYEIGMLIEGFDTMPAFMLTYNPRYYSELTMLSGYKKDKDILSYRFKRENALPEWAILLAEKLAAKSEITIRPGDKSHLLDEVRLMNRIYHDCWSRNWGFVPMTDEEMIESAHGLKHILDEELAFFMYCGKDPIGVGLLVPDINPLLKRLNGSLGLMGLYKLWRHQSDITGLRGLLLGVREEYRQAGAPLLSLRYLKGVLEKKPQYRYVELGWNLEDNDAINLLYQDEGLHPNTRYRIFKKDLKPLGNH